MMSVRQTMTVTMKNRNIFKGGNQSITRCLKMVFTTNEKKIILNSDNTDVGISVVVSVFLEKKLAYLSSKIDTEFGFYLEKYYVKNYDGITYFIVPDQDIIIPQQKVTYSNVEFKETLPYKVNGHKHPDGVTSFSGTDTEYITNNADISLLTTRAGIVQASVRVNTSTPQLGDLMLIILTKNILRMFDDPVTIDLSAKVDDIKSKIEVPTYAPTYATYDEKWWQKVGTEYVGTERVYKADEVSGHVYKDDTYDESDIVDYGIYKKKGKKVKK